MESDNRQLAYKLGFLSRSNIQKEASKGAPRLHRLVSHAAIFDNAARYIVEHLDYMKYESQQPRVEAKNDDYDDDDDDDEEDDLLFDEVEDLEQPGLETSCHKASAPQSSISRNHYAQSRANNSNQIVVTTTRINSEDDETFDDAESDPSTEDSDNDSHSDDDWSDTTYNDDDDENGHSDWKFVDVDSTEEFGDSKSQHQSHDDDLLLWSQQPKVLSQMEADNLLLEAFA